MSLGEIIGFADVVGLGEVADFAQDRVGDFLEIGALQRFLFREKSDETQRTQTWLHFLTTVMHRIQLEEKVAINWKISLR